MKKYTFIFFLFAFIFNGLAQRPDPLLTSNADLQKQWVDSVMQSMTLDEKIGQLFMVQAYSNKDETHKTYIENLITKYHIGNLIFMQGTPLKQAELTNYYQKASKVPLMIGFDGEWGLDMRLKNTYKFPWNMTLGAIQDDALLQEFGKKVGEHCKRIGINVNFAPVVDINTNPENPIIGNRSFGEDRFNVANKSVAFTKGMQGVGVLANAKHFPGHGDTSTDSHVTLPTVDFDIQRIDSIELYPYKKLFDNNLGSVMTAHLSVPSLESNANMPTSLSKAVVTNLLQEKMGFNGLVFTDGLNMKGAANFATSPEINLAALQAGNDILLIPQDIEASIRYIKQAVTLKILPEDRINASVKKVLKAKYWMGLANYKPIELENLESDIQSIEDELLHRKLVRNSLTVVKNTNNLIPISNLQNKKIAYIKFGDSDSNSFVSMLKNYTSVDVIRAKNIDVLLDKIKPYNLLIIGFHKSNSNPWKKFDFTVRELVWLQLLAREKQVILDVFASPYALSKLKSFVNIESILVSYQNSSLSQKLSAQVIFGAFASNGKLPISINDEFKAGDGLQTYSLSRLGYTIPEEVNLSSEKLALLDKYADTILEEKMAPGFQVLAARKGKVVFHKSYGFHTDQKIRKVKNSDVYDLASLTKILASLPLIMKAEEEQKIRLSDKIEDILPSFKDTNKADVSVREVLAHYGRLKAWIPFYRGTQDSITGENLPELYSDSKTRNHTIKVAENLYLHKSYQDSIYKYIREVDQRDRPGYKYSDLGYYLFKKAIEQEYRKPLNKLAEDFFYKALGANRTTYLPLEKFGKEEIVPTEKDEYYRDQLLHGYVHDMGAAMLGGVGGHAGLFANANDVAKIMQMYLQNGFYGGRRFLRESTVKRFNTRYFEDHDVRRGLGFDKPQLNPRVKATCGCVSDESFGHSGFTGTYTWADPESGIVYVFLSNRVYPTMDNKELVKSNMRTKIQQAIQDAIIPN
ncbi:MAG: glycoside hydrolase family 3 N-terminal domain-containing protein [Polaribacter sp.]